MKYYLVIKGNELLIHAASGINLETIWLNGRGQAKKSTLSGKHEIPGFMLQNTLW